MTDKNRFRGVIPALITCFDSKGSFDEKRMRLVVRDLLAQNVQGLYLTGSTGEAFLMTLEERKRVVEVVADETAGRVPLIVHVGAISTRHSTELALHAKDVGVDAISSVPPFYWKFSEKEIFSYYETLCSSVDLPVVVYNVPLAGLMSLSFIEQLYKIPNVCGVKYTATTHYEIALLKNTLGPDFLVFSGCDEMAISGLLFGADGLIGSFYNLMPEVFLDIYRLQRQGDLQAATRRQREADLIILKALEYSYYAVIKLGMKWSGVDAGYCRAPFTNYTDKEEMFLRQTFRLLRDTNRIVGVRFLDAL
ncbi:dihydrodipicolinate synthase family protein [Fretibacterium sp. OH1220_COT-178]|uniref:dihydrodipicolinate synthase family protein n=1 Tax=Fretibacterium sp. OH1220_COT-178 TaxID=2491047 RepID=UPI000F5D5875|nr:dihydrodipicolinate synthase family protein [Fretibacterium sp. OH1220_COT-178]RRD63966.1 dihydrodipicolinate synthase family protein [Fretibacterium sp. OH1220_COT-178]